MYYWRRFLAVYLPILLFLLSLLICVSFFNGGFDFEGWWGKIRIGTLSRPIVLHFILLGLWVILSRERRKMIRPFLRIKNFFLCLWVISGSIGLGLFIWDFYHPYHFQEYFKTQQIVPTVGASLKNTIWFFMWVVFGVWMALSYLRLRSIKESMTVSLEKIGKVFILFNVTYVFLLIGKYDLLWDYRFISLSFLFGLIGFCIQWDWPVKVGKSNRTRLYLWVAIIIFCVIFIVLGQLRYFVFRVYEDFPQSVQALWSTLHGKFMNINFWVFPGEGKSFFAQHFQPLLILFVPLYALIPDPRLLLILQVVGIGLAAFFVYQIAVDRLKKPWLSLAFAFAYLHSPLIQRGVLHDFHLENFIPLFFFLGFYLLQRNKYFWSAIVCLILLTIREDCFMYVMLLGGYVFLFQKQRKIGVFLCLAALAWVWISLHWIIPELKGESSHVFSGRYDDFSSGGIGGLIFNVLSHPQKVFNLMTHSDAVLSMLYMSVPVLFLPWLSVKGLFLIMPLNLMVFLSNFPPLRILAAFYSFMIFPGYILAAIVTTEQFLNKLNFPQVIHEKLPSALTGFIFATVFSFNYFFTPSYSAKHGPMDRDVVEYSPLGMHFSWEHYQSNSHYRIGREIVKKWIPEGAALSTEIRFATVLSNRFVLRCFPNIEGAEYIFLDVKGDPVKTVFRLNRTNLVRLIYEGDYGVIFYEDGWLLLKKGFPKNKNFKVIRELFEEKGVLEFLSKTGSHVPDPSSSWELVLKADYKQDYPEYMIYGRYWDLPEGRYRAIYRLKTNQNDNKQVIAIMDVTALQREKREIIFQKELHGTDFCYHGVYQDFVFDLDTRGLKNVEFRLFYTGYGDIVLEEIELQSSEIPVDDLFQQMIL